MKNPLLPFCFAAAALAAALPAAFAAPSDPPTPAGTASLPDPLRAGWEGESVCELLHEDGEQRILRCTFPPGVGHERHFHGPHFGYVITGGRMRIADATGSREVATTTGGHWTSEGVDWHEVLNIGDATTIYLIVEPKDREADPPHRSAD